MQFYEKKTMGCAEFGALGRDLGRAQHKKSSFLDCKIELFNYLKIAFYQYVYYLLLNAIYQFILQIS